MRRRKPVEDQNKEEEAWWSVQENISFRHSQNYRGKKSHSRLPPVNDQLSGHVTPVRLPSVIKSALANRVALMTATFQLEKKMFCKSVNE